MLYEVKIVCIEIWFCVIKIHFIGFVKCLNSDMLRDVHVFLHVNMQSKMTRDSYIIYKCKRQLERSLQKVCIQSSLKC